MLCHCCESVSAKNAFEVSNVIFPTCNRCAHLLARDWITLGSSYASRCGTNDPGAGPMPNGPPERPLDDGPGPGSPCPVAIAA